MTGASRVSASCMCTQCPTHHVGYHCQHLLRDLGRPPRRPLQAPLSAPLGAPLGGVAPQAGDQRQAEVPGALELGRCGAAPGRLRVAFRRGHSMRARKRRATRRKFQNEHALNRAGFELAGNDTHSRRSPGGGARPAQT